jgi:hypothetical protein
MAPPETAPSNEANPTARHEAGEKPREKPHSNTVAKKTLGTPAIRYAKKSRIISSRPRPFAEVTSLEVNPCFNSSVRNMQARPSGAGRSSSSARRRRRFIGHSG